jgi:acetyl esterase/lipase
MIHGGGWTEGDRHDLADLNHYLASRGYVVAAISYRLAPAWRFPAAQDDLAQAIAYVKTLQTTHGVDPNRIAFIGRSAGAHIGLVAAYTTDDPAIRGVVSFYGPAAMRWGYDNPARPGVIDSSGVLDLYLGGPPATHGEQYDAAEPARFVTPDTPPTLFIQGLRDEHVSPFHAEFVSARLIEAGVPHHIVRLPWATHGCDFVLRGPCGQASTFAVEWFLHAVLYRGEDLERVESP